jgi:ABC-type lipoprotein export system ATPase subunit
MGAQMNDPAVELRDVFCVHRSEQGDAAALQGMNLTLRTGELLAVLGPSGAGKSTLLRVIAGLQLPQAGSVGVLGRDIGRLAPRVRARIRHASLGFLSQRSDTALPPDLPVRSAIALPLALRGLDRGRCETRVQELLEATDLTGAASALARELSGGERQRLALCLALAHRPSLLLADEPTGELDETAAAQARELIARLARENGTSAIIVSHDPATALIADRTIQIRDGRVVEEQRDGQPSVAVVDRGWMRLSDELLVTAGITDRAQIQAEAGGLVVTAGAPPREEEPFIADRALNATPHLPEEPAAVEVRRVTHGYHQGGHYRRVLDQFSHAFPPGLVTVVAGRSGSGKTTLLRLLAGLEIPLSGHVSLDGRPLPIQDAEELAAIRRRRIGYVPQEPSPVGFLSAWENVVLSLRIRDWQPDAASTRAAHALAHLGLSERQAQRVSRLSAGEAQRVALARAVAAAGGLLLLDEPTSRLDGTNAQIVAGLLRAVADAGQTVICATHDPRLMQAGDEILKLDAYQPAVPTAN